jgi:hypothetical protein
MPLSAASVSAPSMPISRSGVFAKLPGERPRRSSPASGDAAVKNGGAELRSRTDSRRARCARNRPATTRRTRQSWPAAPADPCSSDRESVPGARSAHRAIAGWSGRCISMPSAPLMTLTSIARSGNSVPVGSSRSSSAIQGAKLEKSPISKKYDSEMPAHAVRQPARSSAALKRSKLETSSVRPSAGLTRVRQVPRQYSIHGC